MTGPSLERHYEQDARLIILKELASRTDGRLNDQILCAVLETFGHNRTLDWVRTQMRRLADLGAARIYEIGDYLVVEITQAGTDHVLRRSVIEGVKRPSPGA